MVNKSHGSSTARRVQLDLLPNSFQNLLDLKAKLEATSYAETVRHAVKIVLRLWELKNKGTFIHRAHNGKETELIIF